MSFRSKQPAASSAPSRHRSSSTVRSNYANPSRPRSMGFYTGSNTTSYASPYTSSLGGYAAGNSYGSNYQSPYFPNGYRGGTNGYASLTIPAKALGQNYAASREYDGGGRRSRRDGVRGSAGYRERSLSRSRNSLPGSMGSRSISLTSLNSDTGYVSGTERSSRSRVGSTVDIRNENGEIDYKKLYEQQLTENDRLKDKLRKQDEELRDTKQTLERLNVVTSKNSLSELEKRERRAMERKLSEMEEELKQLQKLKAENERLKADNRSLTRVINKLTNSAKK